MSRPGSRSGLTGKPRAARRSSAADWLSTAAASSTSWYSQVESWRPAVTAGSFWRSEPAPLLRGFAYWGRPELLALGVDPRELRLGHEHLAPRLERGGLGEAVRDRADRAQVGRHVLAGAAVAAGRADGEPAALVLEGDREAVDLELRDVGQLVRGLRGGGEAEAAADPGVEGAQLVVAERVGQGQHRPAVVDLGEPAARRRAADLLRRGVGRDSAGNAASSATRRRNSWSYSAS